MKLFKVGDRGHIDYDMPGEGRVVSDIEVLENTKKSYRMVFVDIKSIRTRKFIPIEEVK